MMNTAAIFSAAAYPTRAAAIDRNGPEWLERNERRVAFWADECGVAGPEFVDALNNDLGRFEPTPPAAPVAVDVVVPFCSADRQFVAESVAALLRQNHARPIIHLIADGSPWPAAIPDSSAVVRYETPGQWGPYQITNAVFQHFKTPYMAIHDADDIPRPDRLWRQVATLEHHGADMISSAMQNFLTAEAAADEILARRAVAEPIIRPGKCFPTNPRGRVVNGTRLVRRELFQRMNGFCGLFCTADFEFDNRARFSGVSIVDDQTVLADRRIHVDSLTNGQFRPGTPTRDRNVAAVLKSQREMEATPTAATARKLGRLDVAPELRPVAQGAAL